MDNEPATIYKLIILYLLKKAGVPLTSGTITDFFISYGYTNFYIVQHALGELLDTEMIAENATYHLDYYSLTEMGTETADSLSADISPKTRWDVFNFLEENNFEIADKTSLVSDYKRGQDGSYLAKCTLKEENQVLFELTLNVVSEEDALKVCRNWRSANAELYQAAVRTLLPRLPEHGD